MQEVGNKKSRVALVVVTMSALIGGLAVAVQRRQAGEPRSEAIVVGQSEAPREPVRYKLPVSNTQPSLGSTEALVTVVEWCDLRGPVCRAASVAMHHLLQAHEGKLRWVYRALGNPERAEESANAQRIARAAFQHAGKFWELRDWLLALPDDAAVDEATLRRAAAEVGFDYEAGVKAADEGNFGPAIQVDRIFAHKFGVTPPLTYFVNGLSVTPAPGADLVATLEPVIAAEMIRAEGLVASGTAPVDVYDAIIKDGAWQAVAQGPAPQ